MVRPAPAPRQLADRRPPRGVRTDPLAKKAWLTTAPKDIPLGDEIGAGIHHFLLPSHGWGAVIDTAGSQDLRAGQARRLRLWRNGIRGNPSAAIKKRLAALARRVETLWGFTLRRLTIAESEIRRDIDVWGLESERVGRNCRHAASRSRRCCTTRTAPIGGCAA